MFLYAAPPPGSAARAAKLEPRHWCDPTYEGNGALRALLDPLHSDSAFGLCRTYVSAPPIVTITATATEVMNATLPLLSDLCPFLFNYISFFVILPLPCFHADDTQLEDLYSLTSYLFLYKSTITMAITRSSEALTLAPVPRERVIM